MTPHEARTIAEFLLADLEMEMATTARVYEAVPAAGLAYRPDPVSKTALGLIRHIVLEEEWLLNCTADGAFVPPPDDSDACGIMTPADAVARHRERIPAAIARIRALSDEDLLRPIDMFGMVTLPALQFLSITLKHSVHHRGQLSAYLRAAGGKVPGIYGPSADTPPPGA
jgi:uncharacterized damage-inducible protein DinB